MGTEIGLCCLLSLLLYWNTLNADFCYDDSRAIQKNPDLLPETPISDIFYNDFWGTPLTHSGSHKSYRPLCVLTFRLNYFLGGLNPVGYHLVNVLLHCVVTGLFTYSVRILCAKRLVSAVAGALFAAHPIHTEAVAGIVGRADILACLFFLLSFLCYIQYCSIRDQYIHKSASLSWRWIYMIMMGLSASASMLSKEQGVTVLGVCAIYDILVCHRVSWRQLFKCLYQKQFRRLHEGLVCIGLTAAGLIGFRLYFMGNKPPEFAPADNPASDSTSFLTRTLTFLHLPVVNFWLLLFPKTLSFDWSMEAIPLIESVFDSRNILSVTFYGALIYLLQIILTHYEGHPIVKVHYGNGHVTSTHNGQNGYHSNSNGCNNHNGKHIGNGLSNHIKTTPTNQTSGLIRRRSNRISSSSSSGSSDGDIETSTILDVQCLNILTVSLGIIILPFIPATNLFFYVGFVIAERVLYIPSMGYCLLVSYGAHMLHTKLQDIMTTHKKRKDSFVIQKNVIPVILCVTVLLYSVRTVIRNCDWSNEENLYKSGLHVNPAKAWGNLANILNGQGKLEEAEAAYHEALQHRGNMADVHYNLGILLQEQKRYSEAVEAYKNAIDCRPRLTMAHLNLGIVYGILKLYQEAERTYRHCAQIDTKGLKDPRLHDNTKISALYNLGRLLADQNRVKEAISIYHSAISRMPSHYSPQSLYNMLGEAYAKANEFDNAEKWYRKALHAKPGHIPAHLTIARLMQKKGLHHEAEEWYKKALRISSNDSTIYQHYAQFLGDIGNHKEAAETFVEASRLSPNDFELLFNAANALRQANMNYEAEQYYVLAAKLKPENPTAHMNLGAMLHFNGKLQEAEQSYLRALQLKPDDIVTQTNLKKLRNLLRKAKFENRA